MKFIGIDLAWSDEKPSGLAILDLTSNGLQLVSAPGLATGVDAVVSKLPLAEPSVIAIDAPLVIANETGQRACERAISQCYGRFSAGAHSSNLTLYPRAPSVRLATILSEAGYQHFPVAALSFSRLMLEVYPHPALVVLFGLKTVIRYKKGSVGAKRQGLRLLQRHILGLTGAEIPLVATDALTDFLSSDPDDLAGQVMKNHEDQLDAIVCAYLAAFAWHWQRMRMTVIGDLTGGYIVVPNHTAAGKSCPDC